MKPLLLIECKKDQLNEETLAQVLGYNHQIGAPFISLTNGKKTLTLWKGVKGIESVPFIPKFEELYAITRRH